MPASPDSVFMLIDPLTREAFREGDSPEASGPLFFTTAERAETYARDEELEEYTVHEVPSGVLARMRGKPHWLDGSPRS